MAKSYCSMVAGCYQVSTRFAVPKEFVIDQWRSTDNYKEVLCSFLRLFRFLLFFAICNLITCLERLLHSCVSCLILVVFACIVSSENMFSLINKVMIIFKYVHYMTN